MSMAHHGDSERQSELLKRFRDQQDGTAKREWPEGRVDGSDDGAIVFKVGSDPEKELVILDFGKEVIWTAMSPQDAMNLAQSLIKHARAVAKTPIRIVM